MFPHGAQKLLGWFGGAGLSATLQSFSEGGIPAPLTLLVVLLESFGALALVLGAFGRLAALGIGSVMAVALTYHLENGFFMNWFGNQAGEGFEFHVLAIAIASALVVTGSGSVSVDRVLARHALGIFDMVARGGV